MAFGLAIHDNVIRFDAAIRAGYDRAVAPMIVAKVDVLREVYFGRFD